jgi:hypothetical protein
MSRSVRTTPGSSSQYVQHSDVPTEQRARRVITALLDAPVKNGGNTSSSPALQIASHGRVVGKKIKTIYTGLARSDRSIDNH